MSFFDSIVIADLAHIFVSPFTSLSYIDTSGWSRPRVFLSLLMAVFLLFFFRAFGLEVSLFFERNKCESFKF